jgi:hypothetical protein
MDETKKTYVQKNFQYNPLGCDKSPKYRTLIASLWTYHPNSKAQTLIPISFN